MPDIQQKFATFVSLLTPEEQRAVAPLMQVFSQTMAGPQQGEDPEGLPPPPPPGAVPDAPPPAAAAGPPLPPPDPAAMSIGRQQY